MILLRKSRMLRENVNILLQNSKRWSDELSFDIMLEERYAI